MPKEPLEELLSRLSEQTDAPIPTSRFGRLRRTALAGARAGVGALAAGLRGRQVTLGSLSPEALSRLVESFGELKGVAMKMGQILSYVDASLAPDARQLLAVLQVQSQPTPLREIERTLREELGARADVLLERLDPHPIASASIGQVHRAYTEDGTEVAVKVRHPGIEAAIRADFRNAEIGKLLARAVAPGVNVAEMMAEAEARFLEECDYTLEARRQARFADIYTGHGSIAIPRVHAELSAARVLTTTYEKGEGLETFLAAPTSIEARERAARALYEFYIGTLYRHGLFNADPHPGNLLFSKDGRTTILDHGCVREFDHATVRALVLLSRAVREDDAHAIGAALGDIGMPEPTKHFDVTRSLLRGFYAPLLVAGPHALTPDRGATIGETAKLKRTIMRMRLPGKLVFLFRIRFGLYAVLSRMGAALDWVSLEEELSGNVGR